MRNAPLSEKSPRLRAAEDASVRDADTGIGAHEEHVVAGRKKLVVGLRDDAKRSVGLSHDDLQPCGTRERIADMLRDESGHSSRHRRGDITTATITERLRTEKRANPRADKAGQPRVVTGDANRYATHTNDCCLFERAGALHVSTLIDIGRTEVSHVCAAGENGKNNESDENADHGGCLKVKRQPAPIGQGCPDGEEKGEPRPCRELAPNGVTMIGGLRAVGNTAGMHSSVLLWSGRCAVRRGGMD